MRRRYAKVESALLDTIVTFPYDSISNGNQISCPIVEILQIVSIPSIGILFHAYATVISVSMKMPTVARLFDVIV